MVRVELPRRRRRRGLPTALLFLAVQVSGLGSGVWGLGLGFTVLGLGFRIWSLGLRGIRVFGLKAAREILVRFYKGLFMWCQCGVIASQSRIRRFSLAFSWFHGGLE